jgi:glycosyltransferase involved in cell wall biosynthesis
MYPSVQKKYSGIFVKNQYEELLNQVSEEERIDIFFMKRTVTGTIGSVLKYIRFFFKFIPYYFKKYNVIHLHYFVPLIVLVWFYKCLYRNTKLIVTFHGGDIIKQVNARNVGLYRKFSKKIDLAIPVGNHVAIQVQKKLKIDNILILPVGVNNKVFYPENKVEKIYDFLYVGSFFYVKGIDILYKTIRQCPKHTRFCVVGKGAEYERKFAQLLKEGYQLTLKIDLKQEDLRRCYNQSKFLVQPSRSEGFATVTIESMFCGTPVITSDIPQFKEQVSPSVNGFMFASENPDELVKLLEEATKIDQEKYLKMSEQARKSFPNLQLDKVCNRLLKEYR